MQIKKTPLFLAGLVLGLVAVGSLTYVNAVSPNYNACADKQSGAIRLLSKGKCLKSERTITISSNDTDTDTITKDTNTGAVHIVDATNADLGTLVGYNSANQTYSVFDGTYTWNFHLSGKLFNGGATILYSSWGCAGTPYVLAAAGTTYPTNWTEVYRSNYSTATVNAYKASGALIAPTSVTIQSYYTIAGGCVDYYTTAFTADQKLVPLTAITAAKDATGPLKFVVKP